MNKITLTAIVLVLSIYASAQNKPDWITKLPKAKNNTYRYMMESAIGSTENEARTQAIARIFQSTGNRLGQPVNAAEINRAVQSATDYSVIARDFNIPINKVCEYSERLKGGSYRVYVLCQVAEAGNIDVVWQTFNNCNAVKEFRNGNALLKSVFVPGLGQIGKRRYGEGVFTLLGEVAFVGTGVACYFLAQDELDIMKKEGVSYNDFVKSRDNYNRLQNVSYVAWGAAAGWYVFNLIRAYTAQPRYKDGITLQPVLLPTNNTLPNAVGVGLSWNF